LIKEYTWQKPGERYKPIEPLVIACGYLKFSGVIIILGLIAFYIYNIHGHVQMKM